MTNIDKEIEKVLTATEEIPFEKITPVEGSPLSEPIRNKEGEVNTIEEEPLPAAQQEHAHEGESEFDQSQETFDAPEQQINETYEEAFDSEQEDEAAAAYAKMAANSLIGTADNLLEIGGGYFIKIKKHPEYFDFDEIITTIDQQNAKNCKRIRLEKEDKALLRPLVAEILKKTTTQLTPEQQLLGCLVSIIVKKVQVVRDIREENKGLEQRLRDIIGEKNPPPENKEQSPDQAATASPPEREKMTVA